MCIVKQAFGVSGFKNHLGNLRNQQDKRVCLDENGKPKPLASLDWKDVQWVGGLTGVGKAPTREVRMKKVKDATQAWDVIKRLQDAERSKLFSLCPTQYLDGSTGQTLVSLCTRFACPGREGGCFNMLGTCLCRGETEPLSSLLHADGSPVLASFSSKVPHPLGIQSEVMVGAGDRRIMADIPQFLDGACVHCCTHVEEHFTCHPHEATGKRHPFTQRVAVVWKGQQLTVAYGSRYDGVACQGPKCKPDDWLYVKPGVYFDKSTMRCLQFVPPTRLVTRDGDKGEVVISEKVYGAFIPKKCLHDTPHLVRFFDPMDNSVGLKTHQFARRCKITNMPPFCEYLAPNQPIEDIHGNKGSPEWGHLEAFE
jgi:hypothetical protein